MSGSFCPGYWSRSVVGLVVEVNPDSAKVLAAAREEHRGRAMLDGQIHDINQVAEVVIKVKKQLGEKLGCSLRKVVVAAAGRALKTMREKIEREVSPWYEITEEEVRSLEFEAIRAAQYSLASNKGPGEKYYCIGYSVSSYLLDREIIGNPVGQRGSLLGLELIATFLPQVVVDSLISVLDRAGLEMEMMTLEPIAALEVVIPPTMRQLNLALVDIGAGTSDIAITANGSVFAYAMVPLAGDEVTEKLCSLYLLDFMVGERVKRKLREKETVTFQDILGVKHKVSSQEIINSLEETVKEIACQIGETILNLNQGPPQAVICIGGGSLTPGLTEELAHFLGLSKQRVAVRGTEAVSGIQGLSRILAGPEGVTPLGIALIAARPQTLGLTQVQVNDKIVRLFRGTSATVADALLAAGLGFTELHGKPGFALTVEVNGKLHVIKGSMGQPAEITLNGVPTTFDTFLPPDAVIKVGGAEPGTDATGLVKDVLPSDLPSLKVFYNGYPKVLSPLIFVNGQLVSVNTILVDRAQVNWRPVRTVYDALLSLGYSEDQLTSKVIRVTLNGESKEVSHFPFDVYRNKNIVNLSDELREGDELECYPSFSRLIQIKDLLEQESYKFPKVEINVFVNREQITLTGGKWYILKNGKKAGLEDVLEDGDEIEIFTESLYTPIFADIFRYISFEQTPPHPAARLVTLLNGQKAQFTTPLKSGDKIRVFWKYENRVEEIPQD